MAHDTSESHGRPSWQFAVLKTLYDPLETFQQNMLKLNNLLKVALKQNNKGVNILIYPALFMNRRDDCAGPLFVTDSEEGVRSHAYGRPMRDSVRIKEQARARQHL